MVFFWRKISFHVVRGLSQRANRNTVICWEMQAGHQERCSSCEVSQAEGHDTVCRSNSISRAEITHKPSTGSQPHAGWRQARRVTTVSPPPIPQSTAIPLHLKPFCWLQFKNKINPANIAKQLAVSATSHPAESICPLHDLLARSSLLSPCQILYIQLLLASPDAWLD